VAGKVPGEQAALDVSRPASREVDQDGETLAPVELIGAGVGGRECEDGGDAGGTHGHPHRFALLM
jgi:N-methylhydantoinase B/oxoprolinase/acetone carboxylase alpha subunit